MRHREAASNTGVNLGAALDLARIVRNMMRCVAADSAEHVVGADIPADGWEGLVCPARVRVHVAHNARREHREEEGQGHGAKQCCFAEVMKGCPEAGEPTTQGDKQREQQHDRKYQIEHSPDERLQPGQAPEAACSSSIWSS